MNIFVPLLLIAAMLFLWGCQTHKSRPLSQAVMSILAQEQPEVYKQVCQVLREAKPTETMVDDVLAKLDMSGHDKIAAKVVVTTVIEEARHHANTHPEFLKMIAEMCK